MLFGLVRFYRSTFSYFLGGNCRYYPSCSVYAEECLKTWPWPQATYLIIRRFFRCHPFSKRPYFDPVPTFVNTSKQETLIHE